MMPIKHIPVSDVRLRFRLRLRLRFRLRLRLRAAVLRASIICRGREVRSGTEDMRE